MLGLGLGLVLLRLLLLLRVWLGGLLVRLLLRGLGPAHGRGRGQLAAATTASATQLCATELASIMCPHGLKAMCRGICIIWPSRLGPVTVGVGCARLMKVLAPLPAQVLIEPVHLGLHLTLERIGGRWRLPVLALLWMQRRLDLNVTGRASHLGLAPSHLLLHQRIEIRVLPRPGRATTHVGNDPPRDLRV